jgi:hypothetical protein
VFVAPAASRTKVESTRVSHHRHAETIRRSLRNGLRLIPRSPRSAGLDSLRSPGFLTRGLIPASGRGIAYGFWKAIALICKKDSEDGSRITEIVGWANS